MHLVDLFFHLEAAFFDAIADIGMFVDVDLSLLPEDLLIQRGVLRLEETDFTLESADFHGLVGVVSA